MPGPTRFSRIASYCGLLVLLLLCLSTAGYAAHTVDRPITLTQPDGTTLHYLISGDEYYNWVHDSSGYVIVQDSATGVWVYAVLVGGSVSPSQYAAGTVDPAAVGLTPNIRPSATRIQAARNALFALPMDTAPQPAPTSGALNNIVIFIRFSDDNEYTDAAASYDTVFNSSTAGASSMRNYFYEASYNTLTVTTTFYPTPSGSTVVSYQDSHPRAYYLPYNATTNTIGYTSDGDGGTREQQMIANAVNAVKSQIPSGLNVDIDNNGQVDNVCFVIKGGTSDWGTVLWPHMWSLYMQSVYINSKRVWNYDVQFTSWVLPSGVGVLCHEMLHSLGCPDLYHYTGGYADPVGSWDVMCGSANPPQYPGAYMKYKYLHWITSLPVISTPGVYTLNPLTSSTNNCYKIASPNSTTEFFVLEYRRKTGTFENSVPGSGLLVYRINTVATGNASGPPDEVWVYRPNGTSTTTGNINSAYFSSGSGRTTINDTTNPASLLYNGQPGGLNIVSIGAADSTIQFTYTNKLPNPTISPAGGTFTRTQTVTLTSPNGLGELHYTLNGVDPTSANPYVLSGGTIVVSSDATLKVRSIKTNYQSSDVVSAVFKFLNMDVALIKNTGDGIDVGFDAMPVSAAFTDEFYVEQASRNCGILVRKSGHTLTAGMAACVLGKVQTDTTTGERYISATSAVQNGSATVKPVALNIQSVGGAAFGLQNGAWGTVLVKDVNGEYQAQLGPMAGLNNIGLLTRVYGRVRFIDASTFALKDGSLSELTCVSPSGVTVDPNWDFVSVTGVVSCYKSGSNIFPCLRVKKPLDLVLGTGGMITGRVSTAATTSYSQLVESAHNYANSFNYTWTVTGPANAIRMRAHFTKIELEKNYDFLYVKNGSGTSIQVFGPTAGVVAFPAITNVWSSWVTGNVVNLNLTSDSNTAYYGFQMDRYEADIPTIPGAGVTVTLNPGSRTTTTDADGVYFFRNLAAGTYTVTPSAVGMTFAPTNYTSAVTFGQYVPGKDFTRQ